MLKNIYNGEYDPYYFSVDTKEAVDFIFKNLKNKLASEKINPNYIIPDESANSTSVREAFIQMQRTSDSIVPYSPENQIWNKYIEKFWSFKGYGFLSDFYKDEFLKDKKLLLALANFYKTPDDENLNHLMSLLKKQQISIDASDLIYYVYKELYLPKVDFIITHLQKCISMITDQKLMEPPYSSKITITNLKEKKEYILRLLEIYDIKPSSYKEEQKVCLMLKDCICDYYDSDEYGNDLEATLVGNQDICDAIDEMYERIRQK